jgi:hypothetical protein
VSASNAYFYYLRLRILLYTYTVCIVQHSDPNLDVDVTFLKNPVYDRLPLTCLLNVIYMSTVLHCAYVHM